MYPLRTNQGKRPLNIAISLFWIGSPIWNKDRRSVLLVR